MCPPLPLQGEVDAWDPPKKTISVEGYEVKVFPGGMFICPFCQRHFSRAVHVQDHIRIHTGTKPFQCPVCQYASTQKSNLRKHMGSRHPDYNQAI